ncbi:MAG: hypothetical protein Q7S57_01195 [bacterium]|nr:hypothetical protein [bacterium]
MKNILVSVVWFVLIIVVVVFGLVGLSVYPTAPFGLQKWVPIPVVCAGYYCVTYREWTEAIKKDGSGKKPEVLLSALLLDKATQVTAYYEKVRISKADIKQASLAVEKTINAIPGGKNMLNEIYGGNSATYLSEKGISAILLREKMSALGIISPWESKYAPNVTVWNVGLKWDEASKTVVTK